MPSLPGFNIPRQRPPVPSRLGLPNKGTPARPGPTHSALVRQKGPPGQNLKSLAGEAKKAKSTAKGAAGKDLSQAKKAAAPVQKKGVNEVTGLKKAAVSKQHAGLKRTPPSHSALVRQKGPPGQNLKSAEGQLKKAKSTGKGGAGKELGQAKKAAGSKKAPAVKGAAGLKKAPALKAAASKPVVPKRSALVRQKNVTGQQHLPDRGKAGKITIGKGMSGKKALSPSNALQPAKKVGAVEKKIQKPNKPRGMGGILRARSHTPR